MITKNLNSPKKIVTRQSIFKRLFSVIFVFALSSSLFGKPISVPFELHNSHIYLKTQVNGKGTYYFLFDSGAGTSGSTIDASVAETLNLPVKGHINASMIGGNKRIAYTEDVKFSFDSFMFDEKKVSKEIQTCPELQRKLSFAFVVNSQTIS